jgi:hypothetical protein
MASSDDSERRDVGKPFSAEEALTVRALLPRLDADLSESAFAAQLQHLIDRHHGGGEGPQHRAKLAKRRASRAALRRDLDRLAADLAQAERSVQTFADTGRDLFLSLQLLLAQESRCSPERAVAELHRLYNTLPRLQSLVIAARAQLTRPGRLPEAEVRAAIEELGALYVIASGELPDEAPDSPWAAFVHAVAPRLWRKPRKLTSHLREVARKLRRRRLLSGRS